MCSLGLFSHFKSWCKLVSVFWCELWTYLQPLLPDDDSFLSLNWTYYFYLHSSLRSSSIFWSPFLIINYQTKLNHYYLTHISFFSLYKSVPIFFFSPFFFAHYQTPSLGAAHFETWYKAADVKYFPWITISPSVSFFYLYEFNLPVLCVCLSTFPASVFVLFLLWNATKHSSTFIP